MPIRVVVADDDDAVRAAAVDLLRADGRFDVVAAVADAAAAVAAVVTHRPDVLTLDLRMPGGGLEAARAVRAGDARTTVVVVSARVEPAVLAELLRAGVRGVVLKGRDAAALPDVVARCAAGEVLLLVPAAAAVLGGVAEPLCS